MDKTIADGFKKIKEDLEKEFKNHQKLNNAKVGDTHKDDYGMENGQFKCKIYINNDYRIIILPFEKIQDYPMSNQKKEFVKSIVDELLEVEGT